MHSNYAEDLSTQRERKRYAEMAVLNLSVLPKVGRTDGRSCI